MEISRRHNKDTNNVSLTFPIISLAKQLVTVLVFILFSCQYDPHANLLTTTEPNSDGIVGTYVLDRYFLPHDIKIEDRGIRVEIYSNGTFSATNIPPWELNIPDRDFVSSLISGTGKWEKSVMGTLDPGQHDIWGIYLRAEGDRFHPANFTGDKFPYGLIFTLGDPDSGYAIMLKRQADE